MTDLSTSPAIAPTVNAPEIVEITATYSIHLYCMGGAPCAKLVQQTPKGRFKTKTVENIKFNSEERREQWSIWKAGLILKDQRERAERAAARKQLNATAAPTLGMIFCHSWGYEQTNIDYYEVVAVSGRSVTLRELQQNRRHTGQMEGTCTPLRGQYRNSKEIKKLVQVSRNDGDLYVSMEYGWCEQWDGKPDNWTSYH